MSTENKLKRHAVLQRKAADRKAALAMFRVVHGPGNSGSELEFDYQNPAYIKGWLRLARKLAKGWKP